MAAPLIALVGPTGSGKTALALQAAERCGGEIICADSRTIYRGLDIGTAKPTPAERARVPHHLLDVIGPGESFTAADFQRSAEAAIAGIRARGRVPFVVGGTGLYVDGLLYGYTFGPPADLKKRSFLQSMSLQELHEYCEKHNIDLPENKFNKRYVIRAIEQGGVNHQRERTKKFNALIVGLRVEREALRQKLMQRADTMFAQGVVDEAIEMAKRYGWDSEALSGNIYRLIRRYINGELEMADVKQLFIQADMRLAKRQMTWFKRNPDIEWFDTAEAAYARIVQAAGETVST